MKTAEFKQLVKFAAEKMQSVDIFRSKQLLSQLHCFESGQIQKFGAREGDAIYFILEGQARVTVGRTTREYGPGTCIEVKAGKSHSLINISQQRMVVLSTEALKR